MKIQINQQEIETGIKYYIKNSYGIDINNADIKLTATRGSEGVIADIEINGMCGNSNNDTRGNETKEKAKEPQKEKVSEETDSESTSESESSIPSNSSKESKENNNSESEPKTSSIFNKKSTNEPSTEDSTGTEEPEKSHIGKGIFGQYQRNA